MFKIWHCRFRYISLPVLGVRFPKSITKRTIGICFGPIILVREDYWNDQSTWLHELEHVRQTMLNGILLHFVRYYLSSTYRCNCEIQAYACELAIVADPIHRNDTLAQFAYILSRNYRLSMSQFQLSKQLEFAVQSKLQPKL
jgi:hypothetical protein